MSVVFEQACQDSVGRLRAALVDLYDNVGADPQNPQDVSRRFKLNKTLTWNISRMIQEPDPMAALRHVPGNASFDKLLSATRASGADTTILARVRAAADGFDEMVDIHVGDRATLELILDGLADGSDSLERSRKLAFRGNSGLFGVQARTRLQVGFLAPSAGDSSRLDIALLSGYASFRRLRSTVEWPLFKPRSWSDEENDFIADVGWQPIDQSSRDDRGLFLVRPFSADVLPQLDMVSRPDGQSCVLRPGPIGNPGAFDCFRGEVMRGAVPRYNVNGSDEFGEFGAGITTPCEHLVFDIYAHKDLPFVLDATPLVFAEVFAHGQPTGSLDDASRLPISPTVARIAGSPPAVATPLIPRYAEMIAFAHEQLGWDRTDFRAVRLQMRWPPLGSTVLMRFTLPVRSD